MTVFEKIEAQQAGKENTPAWMVGEQLNDICRLDPHCAEIVAKDLENPSMSIVECEKKIKDSDPETGEKLKGNIREKLLANLSKALDMV
jgi:hypothetical protein